MCCIIYHRHHLIGKGGSLANAFGPRISSPTPPLCYVLYCLVVFFIFGGDRTGRYLTYTPRGMRGSGRAGDRQAW